MLTWQPEQPREDTMTQTTSASPTELFQTWSDGDEEARDHPP